MFDLSKLIKKPPVPEAVSAAKEPIETSTPVEAPIEPTTSEADEVRRKIAQITSDLDKDIDVLDSSICSQVELLYAYVRKNPMACEQLYPEDLGQLCRIHMRMARSGQTEEGKKKVAEGKKKAKAAPSVQLDLSVLLQGSEEKKEVGLSLEDLLANLNKQG
jgi:hypothetical protein